MTGDTLRDEVAVLLAATMRFATPTALDTYATYSAVRNSLVGHDVAADVAADLAARWARTFAAMYTAAVQLHALTVQGMDCLDEMEQLAERRPTVRRLTGLARRTVML